MPTPDPNCMPLNSYVIQGWGARKRSVPITPYAPWLIETDTLTGIFAISRLVLANSFSHFSINFLSQFVLYQLPIKFESAKSSWYRKMTVFSGSHTSWGPSDSSKPDPVTQICMKSALFWPIFHCLKPKLRFFGQIIGLLFQTRVRNRRFLYQLPESLAFKHTRPPTGRAARFSPPQRNI